MSLDFFSLADLNAALVFLAENSMGCSAASRFLRWETGYELVSLARLEGSSRSQDSISWSLGLEQGKKEGQRKEEEEAIHWSGTEENEPCSLEHDVPPFLKGDSVLKSRALSVLPYVHLCF